MQDYLDDPTPRSLASVARLMPEHSAESVSTLLSKVVLARRTGVTMSGPMHGLQLLNLLQRSNPNSYQVALVLPGGAAFVASTPERLYQRQGRNVCSEAVAGAPPLTQFRRPRCHRATSLHAACRPPACLSCPLACRQNLLEHSTRIPISNIGTRPAAPAATRPRGRSGNIEEDFYLGLDLMRRRKEHQEFSIVRDWVHAAMADVCGGVRVEPAKALLKLSAVQHLYGKLAGRMRRGKSDADLLVRRPTPPVFL